MYPIKSPKITKSALSDSGISNGSMESEIVPKCGKFNPAVNNSTNMWKPPKPPMFKIVVGADMQRSVNGNPFHVPLVERPELSCDEFSSDSELDLNELIKHKQSFDHDESDSESDSSEGSVPNNAQFSPETPAHFEDSMDTDDADGDCEMNWGLDDIDVDVITSRSLYFNNASLVDEASVNPVLSSIPTTASVRTEFCYMPKPIEDDLISLHPNDSLNIDDNKVPNFAPQKRVTEKLHINNTRNMPSTSIPNGNIHAFKTPQVKKSERFLMQEESNNHNQQILMYQIPSCTCPQFDLCKNKQKCRFSIHKFNSSMFHGHVLVQSAVWQNLVNMFQKRSGQIMDEALEHFPPALVKTQNRDVLLQMLKDTLKSERIFDRTVPIKRIINALLQIKVDGVSLTYDQIIDEVLKANNFYDGNHNAPVKTLIDIILSITVEQDDFLQYWPLLERMVFFIKSELDFGVVTSIIQAALKETVPISVRSGVGNLLNLPIVDRAKISPILIMELTDAIKMASVNTVISPKSLPTRNSLTLFEEVKLIFTDLNDIRRLGLLFRESHQKVDHAAFTKSLLKIFPIEGQDKENLDNCLKFFLQALIGCRLTGFDEEYRKFWMMLVYNITVFLKCKNIQGIEIYNVVGTLIAVFEDYIEEFHLIPDYYDGNTNRDCYYRSAFLFSRLIHCKRFELAFKWLKTESFALPIKEETSEVYNWYILNVRLLLSGLSHRNNLEECKDLILFLHFKNFDISHDPSSNWNIFDFYQKFLKNNMELWRRNIRDIVNDARESIFLFYRHIDLPTMRNILILLYLKEDGRVIRTMLEIVEFFNEFYQQSEEQIFYNAHLSCVEIQMITFLFFYKMLRTSKARCEIHVTYGNIEQESLPGISTPGIKTTVIDTHCTIKQRVKHALQHFSTHPINRFEGTIKENDVKLILEQMRRRVPPM